MNVTPVLCLAGSAIALLTSAVRVVAEHDLRVEQELEQYPLGARDPRSASARAATAEVAVLASALAG
jgi:hypothetical protein